MLAFAVYDYDDARSARTWVQCGLMVRLEQWHGRLMRLTRCGTLVSYSGHFGTCILIHSDQFLYSCVAASQDRSQAKRPKPLSVASHPVEMKQTLLPSLLAPGAQSCRAIADDSRT